MRVGVAPACESMVLRATTGSMSGYLALNQSCPLRVCALADSVGHHELACLEARQETGVHRAGGRALDPLPVLEYTPGIKEDVYTSNIALVAICTTTTQSAP